MYLSLLRTNRDFRFLYAGALISFGGDWFLTVALLDLVLELTGSATLASLILVFQTLPVVFVTAHAGHLIDRVDRRKLMIAADLARAGACLLPLFARTPALLPFAFAGVIVISVGSAYFEPAAQAALPNIVRPEELGAANVLMGSTWGTMLAVGAAIGGAVTMRFGQDASFVVDAVSFVISALLLSQVRAPFSELRGEHHAQPPLLESIRQTIRFARTHPRVLGLLTVKGGYGVGTGVIALISVYGKEVFRAGALGIGLLFAVRGAGALIGPFLVRGLLDRHEAQYRAITACVLLFGGGYCALALSQTLTGGLVALFFAHLGGGAIWQISTYGLQRETPDFIRGRVFSADYGFFTLTMAVSSIVAGIASDRYGPSAATVGMAAASLVFGVLWGLWTWRLWSRSR